MVELGLFSLQMERTRRGQECIINWWGAVRLKVSGITLWGVLNRMAAGSSSFSLFGRRAHPQWSGYPGSLFRCHCWPCLGDPRGCPGSNQGPLHAWPMPSVLCYCSAPPVTSFCSSWVGLRYACGLLNGPGDGWRCAEAVVMGS